MKADKKEIKNLLYKLFLSVFINCSKCYLEFLVWYGMYEHIFYHNEKLKYVVFAAMDMLYFWGIYLLYLVYKSNPLAKKFHKVLFWIISILGASCIVILGFIFLLLNGIVVLFNLE